MVTALVPPLEAACRCLWNMAKTFSKYSVSIVSNSSALEIPSMCCALRLTSEMPHKPSETPKQNPSRGRICSLLGILLLLPCWMGRTNPEDALPLLIALSIVICRSIVLCYSKCPPGDFREATDPMPAPMHF